jgi:diguanylate cyclase (GGDEF)-like protein
MLVHLMGVGLFSLSALVLLDERRSNQLDPLTLALNRRAGLERLLEKMRSGPSFDLAFVDLKGFKAVNDTHGHAVGDEVLRALADRLAGCVRSSDLVIRYGGDEFLVTGPLGGLAGRLRRAFGDPLRTSGGLVPVAGDVGVVSWRSADGADLERLLGRADAAMYRMKYTESREDH